MDDVVEGGFLLFFFFGILLLLTVSSSFSSFSSFSRSLASLLNLYRVTGRTQVGTWVIFQGKGEENFSLHSVTPKAAVVLVLLVAFSS